MLGEVNERTLLGIATLVYWSAMALALLSLARSRRHSRTVMWVLLSSGLLIQTAGLYIRGLGIGACPLGNPFEIFQFIIWSSVLLVLVIGPVFQVNLLGFVCSAFAALGSTFSLIVPGLDTPYEGSLFGGNPVIELHAALSIFSYGMLALLGMVSVMYLIQAGALQGKRHNTILGFLPSVVQLDRLQTRALIASVLFLTVAVFSGFLLLRGGLPEWGMVKLLAVTAVWAGYGFALVQRLRRRMSARTLACATLVLFGFAVVALWPVEIAREREIPSLNSSRDG